MALHTISEVGGCDGFALAFFGLAAAADFFTVAVAVAFVVGDAVAGAVSSDIFVVVVVIFRK